MTTNTPETATAPTQPDAINYHWIMTVRSEDGRQGTNDGRISAIPGVHTHESTYQAVRKSVEEWMGTEHLTVVFFSLTPNQI